MDEISKKIEDILSRYECLPDDLIFTDAKVPMKVRENGTGKMINCPHGRMMQTRLDITSAADPYKKPIIHFHKYPDHPVYEANAKEFGEAFIHIKADVNFLATELKKLLEEK